MLPCLPWDDATIQSPFFCGGCVVAEKILFYKNNVETWCGMCHQDGWTGCRLDGVVGVETRKFIVENIGYCLLSQEYPSFGFT